MNKKKELIDKINKLQQRITSHDYQIGELQNLVENLVNLQIQPERYKSLDLCMNGNNII